MVPPCGLFDGGGLERMDGSKKTLDRLRPSSTPFSTVSSLAGRLRSPISDEMGHEALKMRWASAGVRDTLVFGLKADYRIGSRSLRCSLSYESPSF